MTISALAGDLRRLGVAQGDLVMVHASLRAIGPVEGGAEGVVAALDASVGAQGSLLMMLGARDDWDWVNARPPDQRAELLAPAPVFDKDETPADPDVGVLAEVFRRLPGTLVNDHPDGRFGARGRLALAVLVDPPWDDYYGPGSPLERLVDAGGKVLRLGADPDTVTLLHLAEYRADVPDKRRVCRHHKVAAPGGPQIRAVSCLDDTDGIVEWPGEDYFSLILRDYLDQHRASTGLVGAAASELIDAADLLEHGTQWMAAHFKT